MALYHITPASNLASIREEGLVPQVGRQARNLGETIPSVWLFNTLENAGNALSNWLGEEFEDTSGELALLAVDVETKSWSDVEFETAVQTSIPASRIAVLCENIDEMDQGFFWRTEVHRPWLLSSPAKMTAEPEVVEKARSFLLAAWRERAAESAPYRDVPADLSGSCIFSSLFAQTVFGGTIVGSNNHQFNLLPDGQVLDLNAEAADVKALGAAAHRLDPAFFILDPVIADQIASCGPRVKAWVSGFEGSMQPELVLPR